MARPTAAVGAATTQLPTDPARRAGPAQTAPTAPGWQSVIRNGYTYEVDADGRTRRVSGQLVTNPDGSRSRSAQRAAGGSDRLPTDDGGHYIAPRFDGPTEAFNYFAQDLNVNRGRYRVLEDQWALAKRAGKDVVVRITPAFEGSSKRPPL